MTGQRCGYGTTAGILLATLAVLGTSPARAESPPTNVAAPSPGAGAPAQGAPKAAGLAPADLETIKALHERNLAGVKVGQMVKDRAGSDVVKSFAAKMTADHGMADKKVAKFLSNRGMRMKALGAVANAVPSAHLAYKDKTGAAYDHAFASQAVDDYHDLVGLVERASKETSDDALRSLLDQLLPVYRVLEATARVLSERKDQK